MHKKNLFIAAILCLLVLAVSAPAYAVAIRMPSLAERVAGAEAIVIGKVESIEEKTVTAPSHFGGDNKIEYQVAVVKVEDGVCGVKGLTHVKVAFQLPPQGGGGPIRPGRGFAAPKLTKDQEVCLLLTKHPTESFFVLSTGFQILDKKNDTFEKEVAEVKKLSKLVEDADKNLKAKDNDDRFLTAALLIWKYRTQQGGNQKTENVDADQSKLILEVLADADWTKQYPALQGMNALNLFFYLGVTEKDGWKQPQDGNKLQEEAKKWVKDHAGSYRLQRFVTEKKDDKKGDK